MKKRVISVTVFLTVTLLFLLIGRFTRLLFAVLAAGICCVDIYRALKHAHTGLTCVTGFCFIALGALYIWFEPKLSPMPAIILLIFATLSSCVLTEKITPSGALLSLGMCLYPLLPGMFIGYILCLNSPLWYIVLITGAASAAICDTFALLGGMRFGRNKLCPRISPNKTIEGSLCGLAASAILGIPLYYIFKNSGFFVPLWGYMLVCAIASTLGQFGDLIASAFKREAGIKDFSNLIPGHGGMLDRLDSHLFAIPAAYFTLMLLGSIA